MAVKYHGEGAVTAAGIAEAATKAGIETDALKAVLAVETNGKAWDSAGRLAMLFEPHVFYRLLSHQAGGAVALALAVKEGLAYEKQGTHPYPRDSYPRFEQACKISEELACQSASWGMGQVLGTNYHDLGCENAKHLVEIMAQSADAQVWFVADFCKVNKLVDALNTHKWAAVARGYNGKNYAINHYDAKLEAAYAKMHVQPRVPVDGLVHTAAVLVHPDAKAPVLAAKPASLRDRMAVAAPVARVPAPAPKEATMDPLKLLTPGTSLSTAAAVSGAMLGTSDIQWVQQRLIDLGYYEVGMADGKGGPRTQGAILAFRNENHLPLDPNLDDDLKLALISGKPRAVAPERATATVAKLRPGSTILKAASWTKVFSIATGVAGLATSYFASINGDMGTAEQQLAPFKILFAFLPSWAYGVVVMALGTGIWFQASAVERARVAQFQSGRVS